MASPLGLHAPGLGRFVAANLLSPCTRIDIHLSLQLANNSILEWRIDKRDAERFQEVVAVDCSQQCGGRAGGSDGTLSVAEQGETRATTFFSQAALRTCPRLFQSNVAVLVISQVFLLDQRQTGKHYAKTRKPRTRRESLRLTFSTVPSHSILPSEDKSVLKRAPNKIKWVQPGC